MAVTQTTQKDFIFTQGLSTATKVYANDVASSFVVKKGEQYIILTPQEFADFYAVVVEAYNHTI